VSRKERRAVTKQVIAVRSSVDLGCTPFHVTTSNGHANVTKQLLVARCNVDLEANDGSTVFHFTVGYGQSTVSTKLLAVRRILYYRLAERR
jgi:hypothetical protein